MDQVTEIGEERWEPDVTPAFYDQKICVEMETVIMEIVVGFPVSTQKLEIRGYRCSHYL
jgi:hypothetical protein